MEGIFMIQDEHVQTLMGLGLTFLQAKTYLALAKLGKADVKTIAKASNVARQDIYRLMPTLQKLGLGAKIIAKPTMYKATPIKEGLSILLQNRKEEIAELQKKTNSLINNFHKNTAKIPLQEENPQFTITSEITLLLKMHKKLFQKTQTSIDAIIPLKAVDEVLFHGLQYYKGAMRRGVKIRMITQKADGESTRKPQALAKNPLFELKCLSNLAQLGMHIFDRKEVTLCLSEESGVPSLWSSNLSIVKLATSYFDDLWNKTEENSSLRKTQKKSFTRKSAKPKQPQTANSQHATKLTKSSSCIGSVSKFT